MTQDELQEEAGILDLACAQLGSELSQRRLGAAVDVMKRLAVIVRKLGALDAEAKALKEKPAADGPAES